MKQLIYDAPIPEETPAPEPAKPPKKELKADTTLTIVLFVLIAFAIGLVLYYKNSEKK